MKVFHNLASFTIQNAVVRLRYGSGVTAFIRLLPQPFFRLDNPPANRGMACQAFGKSLVRLRHGSGVTAFIRLLSQPFFRLATPPANRGMACQAVKKAVSKTDGLLKAGGV